MGRTGFVSRKLHSIWAETVDTATDLGYGTYIVWVELALFLGNYTEYGQRLGYGAFIVWVELALFLGTPQCLLLAQKQTMLAYIPRQCTTTTRRTFT